MKMISTTEVPLGAQSSAVIGNKREQSYKQSDIRIQVADSRGDLCSDHLDQHPASRDNIAEKEDFIETITRDETAAADDKVQVPADTRKVNELRQAILELRVYTCKLKGTNRHLQRQNDMVKEENMSLSNTVLSLERDGLSLMEENEQLRKELELLKKNKLDTTMSTLSSHGDDVAEIEEKSDTIDLVPLSISIDSKLDNMPTTENGDGDSDELQHKKEATKLINNPMITPDKSRDTLHDIDEEEEEEDDVNLRMELGKYREQCEELQTDLRKIAQDYWKQREDLKDYQSRIHELQAENNELQRLKWVEAEVDAMWALVKKWDKENSKWDIELETLRADKEVLKASIVDKSNEIAELKKILRNAPCPDWVQEKMDEIQNDLKQMKIHRHSSEAI